MQVNDRVKCTNDNCLTDITIGGVYKVKDIHIHNKSILIKDDAGDETWYSKRHFEVVTEFDFKKCDLVSGMIIEARDDPNEDFSIIAGEHVLSIDDAAVLDDYNDDLTCKLGSQYDIIAIYEPENFFRGLAELLNGDKTYLKLLWKRTEYIEKTMEDLANDYGQPVKIIKK